MKNVSRMLLMCAMVTSCAGFVKKQVTISDRLCMLDLEPVVFKEVNTLDDVLKNQIIASKHYEILKKTIKDTEECFSNAIKILIK